jgi:hypothetical protein
MYELKTAAEIFSKYRIRQDLDAAVPKFGFQCRGSEARPNSDLP